MDRIENLKNGKALLHIELQTHNACQVESTTRYHAEEVRAFVERQTELSWLCPMLPIEREGKYIWVLRR